MVGKEAKGALFIICRLLSFRSSIPRHLGVVSTSCRAIQTIRVGCSGHSRRSREVNSMKAFYDDSKLYGL